MKKLTFIAPILLLFGALMNGLPYAYFQILRIVVFISSIYIAIWADKTKFRWSTGFLGFIAILFNPIMPIHLSRGTWMLIDVLSGIMFIILGWLTYKASVVEHATPYKAPDQVKPQQPYKVMDQTISTNINDFFFAELCATGSLEQIHHAIKKGVNVNAKDYRGNTALMMAAQDNINPKVIEALIEAGSDIHICDECGETPLMWAAASNRNPVVVTTLINMGMDVNARDDEGMTPLLHAALHNTNPNIAITLIKAGADVNVTDNVGATPLRLAMSNGSSRVNELITTLIKAGSDVNATDSTGMTPLISAASNISNLDVITALIKAGVDVNAQEERDGMTPLIAAARFNSNPPQVVATLLQFGANPKTKDNFMKIALDYARKNKNMTIGVLQKLEEVSGSDLPKQKTIATLLKESELHACDVEELIKNSDKFYIEDVYTSQITLNLSKYNIREFSIPKEILNKNGEFASHKIPNALDLNIFMRCFPLLNMEDGYTLDYVYRKNPSYGNPFVYARKITDNPLESTQELEKNGFSIAQKSYIEHIQYEASRAESVFELGLFCMLVERFYIFWHSFYDEYTYLITKRAVDYICANKIGQLEDSQYSHLAELEYRPQVFMGKKGVNCVSFLRQGHDGSISCLHICFHGNKFYQSEGKVLIDSGRKVLY